MGKTLDLVLGAHGSPLPGLTDQRKIPSHKYRGWKLMSLFGDHFNKSSLQSGRLSVMALVDLNHRINKERNYTCWQKSTSVK